MSAGFSDYFLTAAYTGSATCQARCACCLLPFVMAWFVVLQTYCAGYFNALPYDPSTTPPTQPGWYDNVQCQVVPSMLCCFRNVSVESMRDC
jgi:hypothetical protein